MVWVLHDVDSLHDFSCYLVGGVNWFRWPDSCGSISETGNYQCVMEKDHFN